jgi:hypothetical protein
MRFFRAGLIWAMAPLALAACRSDDTAEVAGGPDANVFVSQCQDAVRSTQGPSLQFGLPVAEVERTDADVHIPYAATEAVTGRPVTGNVVCRFERGQLVEMVPEKSEPHR